MTNFDRLLRCNQCTANLYQSICKIGPEETISDWMIPTYDYDDPMESIARWLVSSSTDPNKIEPIQYTWNFYDHVEMAFRYGWAEIVELVGLVQKHEPNHVLQPEYKDLWVNYFHPID